MPPNAVAPAEVGQDQSRGGSQVGFSNDDITARHAKRKPGNFWFEDDGRYLFRSGATGTTVFDTWKLIGEPLPKMGRT